VTRPVTILQILVALARWGAPGIAVRAADPAGRVDFKQFGGESFDGRDNTTGVIQAGYSDEDSRAARLPPLEEELDWHGGSSLYEPQDVTLKWYRPPNVHWPVLRLPPDWQEPQPLSFPNDFLGAHPIFWDRAQSWFGEAGYQWEPRLVGYGSYEIFGSVFEDAGQRRDGTGHQLIIDLDLALTATERVHVQFRPLGGGNSGGSFWSFSEPEGYEDNSDGVPQRWWIEGERQSIFGGLAGDTLRQWDINVTLGKFPLVLQNFLLMNDEVTGVLLGKNNLLIAPFSNVNVQTFYLFDEVDAFTQRDTELFGVELTADYRLAFIEATYIHAFAGSNSGSETDFFAFSGTQFFGAVTLAGRAMFKVGDRGGSGDGQLYVLESNHTRIPANWIQEHTGVELTVTYLNLFKATSGWQSVAGGNFDRLQSVFVLSPLLQIAAGRQPSDTAGASLGVQLFRKHQDESIIPEIAYQDVSSESVLGIGLQYERKLSPRTYLNIQGVRTWSDNPQLVREGVLASLFVLF